LANVYDVKYQM